MHRWISVLLILVLVLAMLPFEAFAADAAVPIKKTIPVIVDKDGKVSETLLSVVVKDGELFVQPQDLPRITRYDFTADGTRLIFRLGLKSVVIDTVTQTMQANFIKQDFSGCLEIGADCYLPMSELLPWLNVQCYEANGKLHIDSDLKSYWEVLESFDSTDYLFDLAETYGQTTGDVIGLCAIGVFDCILDMDNIWKKVVTVDGGDTRLYDYEIYQECFREFALPETGTEAEVQKSISTLSGAVSDSSQFVNICFETLYNEEMHDKLAERFGDEIAAGFDELPAGEAQLSETLKLAKTALKYIKTGYLYTRIAMTDTTDYADALHYIYLEGNRSTPKGIELAASKAVDALGSQKGAVTDAACTVLSDIGIKMLDKTVKTTTEDALKSVAGDTILGSFGIYLDIVDTSLTMVWPINDAYEEITKMTVYQSMQYDALDAFYTLSKSNVSMSTLDVSNGRTAAIIFLKTAKKCYQAQQDTFDLFGGEGVLEYRINDINCKLLEFELSMLAEEHDAIDDKSTEIRALKRLWEERGFIKEAHEADMSVLVGTWNLYSGGEQNHQGGWYDVAVYSITLSEDGFVGVSEGVVCSEYYAGYTGTWSAVPSGKDQFQVHLDVTGGDLIYEEATPEENRRVLVQITIKDKLMMVEKISGDDICLVYGEEYEKDLSSETWEKRQLKDDEYAVNDQTEPPSTQVTIKVWTPEEDQSGSSNWLTRMEKAFAREHPEYSITWVNEVCHEGDVRWRLWNQPGDRPDVFMYESGSLTYLLETGALSKLSGSALQQVRNDNSKTVVNTVTASDGGVYGLPVEADTWFMYYNKAALTEEDVKSLDVMLEKVRILFPWTNGWYSGTFFLANDCTLFGTDGQRISAGIRFGGEKGYAAAQKMVELAEHPNMEDAGDDNGKYAFMNRRSGVYFSGAWDYQELYDVLGEDLGVAQLPTIEIDGKQKQMKSLASSYAVGVHPDTNYEDAAMAFAMFLATPEAQKSRYVETGVLPLSTELKNDSVIANDELAMALLNVVASTSVVCPSHAGMRSYWTPMGEFSAMIISGEIDSENYHEYVDRRKKTLTHPTNICGK